MSCKKIRQLEIEKAALSKEKDGSSMKRLEVQSDLKALNEKRATHY